jgi:hypothetical protein
LGTSTKQWAEAHIDTGNIDTVTATNIDGILGANTAAAATVTSLNVSDGNITNVGDINCDSVSADAALTGLNIDFSAGVDSTATITMGDTMVSGLNIKNSSTDFMTFDTATGKVKIGAGGTTVGAQLGTVGTPLASIAISTLTGQGTLDGFTIGGNVPGAATVTTLTATGAGTLTGGGTIAGYAIQGGTIGATTAVTSLAATGAISLSGAGSISGLTIAACADLGVTGAVSITGAGSANMDGVIIGKSTAAAGTFTALTATGDTTLGNANADSTDVNGNLQMSRFNGANATDAGTLRNLCTSSLSWTNTAGYSGTVAHPARQYDGTMVYVGNAYGGESTSSSGSAANTFFNNPDKWYFCESGSWYPSPFNS